MTKVLIANRGEIAVRIARALAQQGMRSVAVFAADDRHALHVRSCDEAHALSATGPGGGYLDAAQLVAIARQVGAQAVHPGYGFLAESADFASQVAAAGLTFIGPPPAAIATMGCKARARAAMQAAGVPCVPGSLAAVADVAAATAEAQQLGYPVMLKAVAGGGGRGMRRLADAAALAHAWPLATAEAAGAFGDGRLYLEKALVRPRHVEVQIFAEADGQVVSLGERDCSLQRRHQKVIEEAPAPHLAPPVRAQLHKIARQAAAAVAYRGAGTIEFLADGRQPDRFYFLEMNTRLQVEHPVTELCFGVDLVAAQLACAAGQPTAMAAAAAAGPRGHAIEARLCAEDPLANFAPSPGRISRLRWPQGPGVRIDAGVAEGDQVSGHFDPMLAKIIAYGADRAQARARLGSALAQTEIVGVNTNLAYLRHLLDLPEFICGDYHTHIAEAAVAQLDVTPSAEQLRACISAAVLARLQQDTAGAHRRAMGPAATEADGRRHTQAWRAGQVGGV